MKVSIPIGLGVTVVLDAPDGADEQLIAKFVHAIVDQLGRPITDVTGEALAALARLDDSVDALGAVDCVDRRRLAEGVRAELRRVRSMLRPLNVELWGSALRRRIDGSHDETDRARRAKGATTKPRALKAPKG